MEWILCLAREGAVEEILTEAHKDWRNQRKTQTLEPYNASDHTERQGQKESIYS